MTTLGDLVASIHSSLHSFTGVQEQVTWLTAAVDSDDLTFAVGSSDSVLRGIAEVDDELVYVDSSAANVLSLTPFGRGYRGSTAAAHAQNAMLTFDPVFPKVEIRRAITQCIEGLFPALYQVKTTDITYTPQPVGFNLPTDCEGVLEVKAKRTSDPLNYWVPVTHWEDDMTSPEVNGKSLNIFQVLDPGCTIRVVYRAKFDAFASDASTLTSVGLSESYADLVLYGVSARMIRFLDATRLQVSSVENLSRSTVVGAGEAGKIANQLYAMYQQRLTEERSRLLELKPPRANFTR